MSQIKPRLQWLWGGWYCYAVMGVAVWGRTPKIAFDHWLAYNPEFAQ